MKKNNFGIVLVILFILLFGILSLPNFRVEILGREVSYKKINPLSLIASNTTLGSFSRGYGINNQLEYSAEITFAANNTLKPSEKSDKLNSVLSVINQRAKYSGLSDVLIKGEISDDHYMIKADFPDRYQNSKALFSALVSTGEIVFLTTTDGKSVSQVNLTDKDIVGSISSIYESLLNLPQKDVSNPPQKEVLRFNFKDSSLPLLTQIFSTSQSYFLMIAGENSFNLSSVGNGNITTLVDAVPSTPLTNTNENNQLLGIISSYFLTQPLKETNKVDTSSPITIQPLFNPENVRFIVITFILIIFVLTAISLVGFKKNRFIKYLLMFYSFITIYIFLLKFVSSSLSIYSIIGIGLMMAISTLIIWKLITTKENSLKQLIDMYRDYSIGITISMLLIFKLTYSLIGNYTDFVGACLIGFICIIFCCLSIFRVVSFTDFSDIKLPFINK